MYILHVAHVIITDVLSISHISPLATPSYAVSSGKKAKKKLAAPDISLTLDRSEGSILSDELDDSAELDLDDIDTPSDNSNEFEWEGMNHMTICSQKFFSVSQP